MDVPSDHYQKSLRTYPKKLPDLEYPSYFRVVRTNKMGRIYFLRHYWQISSCLNKELVGLEECENNCWRVYFGSIQLGVIDLSKTIGSDNSYPIIRLDGKTSRRGVVNVSI